MNSTTERVTAHSALRELAQDDSSRKSFLKLVGGAGAASAFAIFLAACGGDEDERTAASSQTPAEKKMPGGNDLTIVQYALTLEHLETDFYNAVLDSGV
jgi:hypothetical protein